MCQDSGSLMYTTVLQRIVYSLLLDSFVPCRLCIKIANFVLCSSLLSAIYSASLMMMMMVIIPCGLKRVGVLKVVFECLRQNTVRFAV